MKYPCSLKLILVTFDILPQTRIKNEYRARKEANSNSIFNPFKKPGEEINRV